jgi:HNH endonuclease
MTLKEDLRPTGRNRVIDLVSAAGVNVSPWSNFGRGAKWAAANPKYCYEWAFVEAGVVVVLNLWYAHMQVTSGSISVSLNARKDSQRLKANGAKSVWISRAERVDTAIQRALKDKLKLRVIVNDGTMRDAMDPKAKASKVKHRYLDPVPWTIASYKFATGDCVLVRGGKAITFVDQFDVPIHSAAPVEQVDVHGTAYVRDPAVRAAALLRANGRCEYCNQPGFALPNGAVFLETHHIVPLSAGGSDHVSNVAGICPNHHREAHYGAAAQVIRDQLLLVAAA